MTLNRSYLLVVALAAAALLAALGAGPAAAKSPTPCWKVLINDWYDGRIDGTYAIPCYREALRRLPKDVQEYSSARDDIRQALQKRITQGVPGRPGTGATDTEPTDTEPTDTGPTDTGPTPGPQNGGEGGDSQTGSPPGRSNPGGGPGDPGGANPGPGDGGDRSATPGRETDGIVPGAGSADSVPVPLIVLASLAALLMAAGAAGFTVRRLRARRLELASAAAVVERSGEPPRAE